jgi:hypothetical protein
MTADRSADAAVMNIAYADTWDVYRHECARCLKQIRVVGHREHMKTRTAEFYRTNPGGPRGPVFCSDCRVELAAKRKSQP